MLLVLLSAAFSIVVNLPTLLQNDKNEFQPFN